MNGLALVDERRIAMTKPALGQHGDDVSLMPSEKYSCSASPPMLTRSTAMAGRSGNGKPARDCSRLRQRSGGMYGGAI
jgi:hypothetical protein